MFQTNLRIGKTMYGRYGTDLLDGGKAAERRVCACLRLSQPGSNHTLHHHTTTHAHYTDRRGARLTDSVCALLGQGESAPPSRAVLLPSSYAILLSGTFVSSINSMY